MGERDPRIDACVARAAPFPPPVLQRVREVLHETCPEVAETLKWPMPAFTYAGGTSPAWRRSNVTSRPATGSMRW